MKTLFLIVLLLLIICPGTVAYAQDPTAEPAIEPTAQPTAEPTGEATVVPPPFPVEIPENLPDTAAEGVDILALALGALAGLLSKYLTNAIKDAPFLSDENKSKISGPAAIFLAAVVSVVTGYILSMAGVAANFLDSSGVWQVLLTAWPWAYKFYNDAQKPVVAVEPVVTAPVV